MRYLVELVNFFLGENETNLIITLPGCRYCDDAKRLMDDEGLYYREVAYSTVPEFDEKIEEIRQITGHMTFPMIFIDRDFVGGYTQLKEIMNIVRSMGSRENQTSSCTSSCQC